jgi:arylamine N-acetyltransferase
MAFTKFGSRFLMYKLSLETYTKKILSLAGAMTPYTPEQLELYFNRIRYKSQHPSDQFEFLAGIQKHHLVWIPFETLSLHYSTTKNVSLDPQDLFEKIVVNGRGGYCYETNALLSGILSSLGFQVINVVCRITAATRGLHDGSWRAM